MMTKEFFLAARPTGLPDKSVFQLKVVELPDVDNGYVLLKAIYISVDPYMRGRMSDKKSYIEPYKVNEPIEGGVIAEVVQSKSNDFNEGDKVYAILPWAEYCVAKADKLTKINDNDFPLSYYLGILGLTGLTAYFGTTKICNPKAGEYFVVSGAAGAVGMVVGQIAKIMGCHVIGIAGSDEKAIYLIENCGYDYVFNYKNENSIEEDIKKICPNGVDCYFDNVGGDISDAVISNITFNARIAICGQIAMYNDDNITMGRRFLPNILIHSAMMQGFIVGQFKNEFPQAIMQLSKWIKEGKLKTAETIIDGFESLPDAFLGLFLGKNVGKMIVRV